MATQSPVSNSPKLDAFDSQLAARVKDLSLELKRRGAKNGARRLEEVSQQFQYFTVEGASQYIRKDEILDELENQSHLVTTILHGARNFLSIAPIVFTWLALHLAADAYDKNLTDPHYPNDVYQPFLLLWQQGFHGNHGPVIPFSAAAFWDALLLFVLVLLVVAIIPLWEGQQRKRIHASLEGFDATIDNLLAALGQAGADAHLADSDIKKISQAITKSVEDTLSKLLMNYDRVADGARKFVEDTHTRTSALVQGFNDNLALFNSDVRLLSNDVQKLNTDLDSYGQKLTELTDASSKMAGSSADLAVNAKALAESASLNSQASQGISGQLNALNTTQQDIIKAQKEVVQELATTQQQAIQGLAMTQQQIVQEVTTAQQTVVQKVADSQKEVVDQLTGAADTVAKSGQHTRDAANELDRVASNLEQLTRKDFQDMTDGVKQANQALIGEVQRTAAEVQQIVGGLNQVSAQLQQTTQALAATAGNAQNTSRTFPGKWVYYPFGLAAAAVIFEGIILIMRIH